MRVVKFLGWTFALAFISKKNPVTQIIMVVIMFVPTLGVILSGVKFSSIQWKPRFRKNAKLILLSWFLPSILTALGALLYLM